MALLLAAMTQTGSTTWIVLGWVWQSEPMRVNSSLLKWALRQPVRLYDIGAGRLFGHRFLLLTHRGRRSGRRYRTMLEVVRWDAERGEATVMSGFGDRSNWLLNIRDGGAWEIQIATRRFRPVVRELGPAEAVDVIADYERRSRLLSPVIRLILSRLAGFRYDGTPEQRRRLVEVLPLVAFQDSGAPFQTPG